MAKLQIAEARKASPEAPAHRDQIPGWGADLDHGNRPAYPMERTPPRLEGLHWERPADQPLRTKIYHSIERPGVTPVFGTSTPPSGLSGKIRNIAYKLSENDVRHWLLLLFADRVNVLEGIVADVIHGRIPNIFSEMGAKAEFKHNPVGFAGKALLASAVVGGAYRLYSRRANAMPRHRADSGEAPRRASIPDTDSEMDAPTGPTRNRVGFAEKALLASAIVGGACYLLGRRTHGSPRR